jgi:hypothetical protein
MIENGRVLTGCDTCDYSIYDVAHNCQSCSVLGLDYIDTVEDGCPNYKMVYTYFCQNHAQYDKYTGLMKDLRWF